MVERERDARGRAQNARPRDALGRPLPRGAVGVERVPEDLVLEPVPALVHRRAPYARAQAWNASTDS
ncbi:MAG: DUF309 domain-containing protein, partial [Propionibacteriaceae bacterium]